MLAGKYRVDEVLGSGGMGVVVAAHHLQLDERVAIKFLLPETLASVEAVSRFAREARAAVKIKSEHVARVLDVGTLDSGAPYMVMEYLVGEDLAARMKTRGRLAVQEAVDFVLQACEAIAEAHSRGIVHRDLKPANLFVARLPGGVESIKVLDFGISKLTGLGGSGGQSSATRTSALMGSPLYMSPEQMQSSKNVDSRGDIWALGVILYELVTGVSPFSAETMPELVLKVITSEPRPLRDFLPEAPQGFDAAVVRCLQKDRGRRYQTVGDLASDLLRFGSPRARVSAERIARVLQLAGISAAPPPAPAPASDNGSVAVAGTGVSFGGTVPGRTADPPHLLTRPRRPRRATFLAAAAVAFVVLGGLVAVSLVGGAASTEDPQPDPQPAVAQKHGEMPVAEAPKSMTVSGTRSAASAGAMPAAKPPNDAAPPTAASTHAPPPRVTRKPSSQAAPTSRTVSRSPATAAPAQARPPTPAPSPASEPKKPTTSSLIDDRH